MATVEYAHIVIGPDNVAMLAGTTIKVVEIATDHVAWGWDAQEIHRQHPHLPLGQVYSALAYYYDHKAEMDLLIEQRDQEAARLQAEITAHQGESPLMRKLKATGRVP